MARREILQDGTYARCAACGKRALVTLDAQEYTATPQGWHVVDDDTECCSWACVARFAYTHAKGGRW